MSSNDLVKEQSHLLGLMTPTTQLPQYLGQLSKSCHQSSPSSTSVTGYSQHNNAYQSSQFSTMFPLQQQHSQKPLPNSTRFWNSRNFINLTNGGHVSGLSNTAANKEMTATDFVTGGASINMSNIGGGYTQLPNTDLFGQDFSSLPAAINSTSSVHDNGGGLSRTLCEMDPRIAMEGNNHQPDEDSNILRGFSEPCLLNVQSTATAPNESRANRLNHDQLGNALPSSNPSNDTEASTNKLFSMIMEHIQQLHDTNSRICRNLHETKVDIEALKYTPNWNLRHRRDSISGLSTHSQPVMFGGGAFSTQSSTSPYSGAYNPGMMTDVVREVKEAARVREDAMLNRVKSLVEERQWSLNEYHLRIMRDLEDIKSQLNNLYLEKKESSKRISHLEDENRQIWQLLASLCRNHNASNVQQIVDDHLNARLQRRTVPSSGHLKYHEVKDTGSCLKCVSLSPTTLPPSPSSNNTCNRHFSSMYRTSGLRNNNNGYATSGSSPPNFAIITPTTICDDLSEIHINSSSNLRNQHPSGHSTTESISTANEHENRTIVAENLVGLIHGNSNRRHPLNSTVQVATNSNDTPVIQHQFINGMGHIHLASAPVKQLTTATASSSTAPSLTTTTTTTTTATTSASSSLFPSPSSCKRSSSLMRETDVGPLMHSNTTLINSNNSKSSTLETAIPNSGTTIHHHSSRLSIAGPITDL